MDGWRVPRRAVLEYGLGGFCAGTLSFIGNRVKQVLGALVLRVTPPPTAAKLGGMAAALILGLTRRRD
ncbi:MAG: hypothetical protein WKF44_09685 [Rubrobacteraceae bacterium]